MNETETFWESLAQTPYYKDRRTLSESDKLIICRRSNWFCVYCGKSCRGSRRSFDHITPQSKGGTSTPDNFVLSCPSCNSRKQHRDLDHMRHLMALHTLQWPKMPPEVVAWAERQGASVEDYHNWKFWFERSDCKYARETRHTITQAMGLRVTCDGTGT